MEIKLNKESGKFLLSVKDGYIPTNSQINNGLFDDDWNAIEFSNRDDIEERLKRSDYFESKMKDYSYLSKYKGLTVYIKVNNRNGSISHSVYGEYFNNSSGELDLEHIVEMDLFDVKLDKLMSYIAYRDLGKCDTNVLNNLVDNIAIEYDDKLPAIVKKAIEDRINEARMSYKAD